MQAFILIGSRSKQQEYLEKFQNDNSVPSYLLLRFETFKILDARVLQKTLSLKLHEDDRRMIVISSPTLEAQHAILKTVEELPESAFVFFLVQTKDDLIPTILSRGQEIYVGGSENSEGQKIRKLENQKTRISENLFGVDEKVELQDVEDIIRSVRALLLEQISDGKPSMVTTFHVLKQLSENYQWAKNNNVNRKMAVEIAAFDL